MVHYDAFITAVSLAFTVVNARIIPDNNSDNDVPETVYVTGLNVYTSRKLSSPSTSSSTTPDLPDSLDVQFDLHREQVQLNLRRNTNDYFNVEVKFQNPETAVPVPKKGTSLGLYQDLEKGAAISVTTPGSSTGQMMRNLRGSFKFGESHYEIEPAVSEQQTSAERSHSANLPPQDSVAHIVRKAANKGQVAFKVIDDRGEQHDFKTIPEDVLENLLFSNNNNNNNNNKSNNDSTNNDYVNSSSERRRRKRETLVASYHVELLFVIDHSIWEFWVKDAVGDETVALERLMDHYAHQMNGIDMVYKNIDPRKWGFQITPWLAGYHIAKTFEESYWTTDAITQRGSGYSTTAVDGDVMLKLLGEWSVDASEGRSWEKPDHTMLWTKYDIFGNRVIGYSYVGGVCKPKLAVSIQEDHGVSVWSIAAHELGHNLGASHDGYANACDASDYYLMTPSGGSYNEDNIFRAFQFSDCSLQSFKTLLSGSAHNGYPRVCLTNSVEVCEAGNGDKQLEVLSSADKQCHRHYGQSSSNCYKNGETVCQVLYCYREYRGKFGCWSNRSPGAADGVQCGYRKWCLGGKCVLKEDNPLSLITSNDGCPVSGLPSDVPDGCTDLDRWSGRVNGVSYTCRQIVLEYPQFCFTWSYAETGCCATCHRNGLATPTKHIIDLDSQELCLPGTYLNRVSCVDCPKGSYQDESGSTSCKKCSRRDTTLGTGSVDSSACFRCRNRTSWRRCRMWKGRDLCTSEKKKTSNLSWAEYMFSWCMKECGIC